MKKWAAAARLFRMTLSKLASFHHQIIRTTLPRLHIFTEYNFLLRIQLPNLSNIVIHMMEMGLALKETIQIWKDITVKKKHFRAIMIMRTTNWKKLGINTTLHLILNVEAHFVLLENTLLS